MKRGPKSQAEKAIRRPDPEPEPMYYVVPPPSHLSLRSKDWWKSVVAKYELADHHLVLLQLCCEALDRCDEAREILDREGMTYMDRFGSPKARPETIVERDSRVAVARLLREIGVDAATPPTLPRPHPLPGYR